MFKKIISTFLIAMIFVIASNANAFAQTNSINVNETVAKQENKADAGDFNSLIKAQNSSVNLNISDKSTLSDYEKQKKRDKKFSTTTKVLIGVGIAAAIIGVVVFAASRDKIKTF